MIPNSKKNRKKKQRLILTVCCAAIAVLLCIIGVLLLLPTNEVEPTESNKTITESKETKSVFSLFERKPRIPEGVTISGILVGDMTEEKAFSLLEKRLPSDMLKTDIVIFADGHKMVLTPEQSGIHWDISSAVSAAFKGDQSEITAELKADRNAVTAKLESFFDTFGGVYSPASSWLEGEMPDLAVKDKPCQTLVIRKGSSGYLVDLIDIYDQIMDGYKNGTFQINLGELGDIKEPASLDLADVYRQVSVAPVDPEIDKETLEVIPGKDGYGFDLAEAKRLYQRTKKGDTIRISMEYVSSELSEEDAWFKDVLGYCKTEYTDNEDRNENLRLACSMLNGLILQPGETLSYNLTLGQRTREAGYKPAPAYSGTELVNEIGGGICQVSSTLYLSSLLAELNIIERKNHGFPANYIPLGLDATVNWGTTDLKVRNDYDLPVKILAEATDGYVRVKIMGVERRDYYVKMEYRVDDHPSYAAAYRCRYDRETGEEIFRNLDHTSIYLEDVWCWPGYAENATDEET